MVYLQACVNEAMRLVPGQATGSARQAARRETLLGFAVPAGTTVLPNTRRYNPLPRPPRRRLCAPWLGLAPALDRPDTRPGPLPSPCPQPCRRPTTTTPPPPPLPLLPFPLLPPPL